ncbi:hypothetical protein ACULL3_02340 [Xanthomonas arboricola pv. corylina]|uniref:hypothetical protein n=1 Tax=Xanthomonas arboricola TaxID=56448 RepID=UPI0035F0DCFF
MTWRTPSSLKWLIVKHSRLQGEIELLHREAAELDVQVIAHRQRLEKAERSLLAIETSLGMHEVQVDVAEIAAVRPHVNRACFRHGDLTRNLYATLKMAGDWLTTGELVERLTGHTHENCDRQLYERVRRSFRKRLTSLVLRGAAEREFTQGTTDRRQNHTRWRLLLEEQ